MKIIRNIFMILTLILLAPLIWHAVAPTSLCWLQPEQIVVVIVWAVIFGVTTFALHGVPLKGGE